MMDTIETEPQHRLARDLQQGLLPPRDFTERPNPSYVAFLGREYHSLYDQLVTDEVLYSLYTYAFDHARDVLGNLDVLNISQEIVCAMGIAAIIIDLPPEDRGYVKDIINNPKNIENKLAPTILRLVEMRGKLEQISKTLGPADISAQPIFDNALLRRIAAEIGISEIFSRNGTSERFRELIAITIDTYLRQIRSIALRDHPELFDQGTQELLQDRKDRTPAEDNLSFQILWPLLQYTAYTVRGTPVAKTLVYLADLLYETSPQLINPNLQQEVSSYFWSVYLGEQWFEKRQPASYEEAMAIVQEESIATAQDLALLLLTSLQEVLTPQKILALQRTGTISRDFRQIEQPYQELSAADPDTVFRAIIHLERYIKALVSIAWKTTRRRPGDDPTRPHRGPMSGNQAQLLKFAKTPFATIDGTVIVDGVQIPLVLPVKGIAFFDGYFKQDEVARHGIQPRLSPWVRQVLDKITEKSNGKYVFLFLDEKHADRLIFPWLQLTMWDTVLDRVEEVRIYPAEVVDLIEHTHFLFKQAYGLVLDGLATGLREARFLPTLSEISSGQATAHLKILRPQQEAELVEITWPKDMYPEGPKNLDAAIAAGQSFLWRYLDAGPDFQHMVSTLPDKCLTSTNSSPVNVNAFLSPLSQQTTTTKPKIADIIAAINRTTTDATLVLTYLLTRGGLSELDVLLRVLHASGVGPVPTHSREGEIPSQAGIREYMPKRLQTKISEMVLDYIRGILSLRAINKIVSSDPDLLEAYGALRRITSG